MDKLLENLMVGLMSENLFESDSLSFIDKDIELVEDLEYRAFTMPKGSKGRVTDGDGGMLEVRFESNGKTLEVPPTAVKVVESLYERSATELQQQILAMGLDPSGKSTGEMEAMLGMALWAKNHPNEPFPEQFEPMTAHDSSKKSEEWMNKTIKDTDWWIQEKYDGMRSILIMDNGKVRMPSRTRSVGDFLFGPHQDNFPHFRDMVIPFEGKTVLDGELTSPVDVIDTGATMTASKLQAVMAMVASKPEKSAKMQADYGKAEYNAYDILFYDGKDVRDEGYEQRSEYLDKAVKAIKAANPDLPIKETPIIKSYQKVGDIFKAHTSKGAEGVMLKKRSGKYTSSRSHEMLKMKRNMTIDGWISGSTPATVGKKNEHLIGGFEISTNLDGKPHVIAAVSGIDDKVRNDATILKGGIPSLNPAYLNKCVEIQGQEITKNMKLKHAKIIGWRDDKRPEDCFIASEDLKKEGSES